MGKINLQRAILGGLLAGVVLNVYDFLLYRVILKADLEAAMRAIGKSVAPSAIYQFIALDFLWGIWLVWLYAAIRPRFGPGPLLGVARGVAAPGRPNQPLLRRHANEVQLRSLLNRQAVNVEAEGLVEPTALSCATSHAVRIACSSSSRVIWRRPLVEASGAHPPSGRSGTVPGAETVKRTG